MRLKIASSLLVFLLVSCTAQEKQTNHTCVAKCKACKDLELECNINGERKEIKISQ
jgi:hypothetical protein